MAERLTDKSASNVAKALLLIFLKHGFYGTIHSDWGDEFINQITEERYKLTGTQRHTNFSLMPRQNLVERSHRAIHSIFAKISETQRNWSQLIDYVAFAYNSTCHRSTGFTPHYLHFWRELENPRSDEWQSYGEFAQNMTQRMQIAFQPAHEVLQREAISAKRYHDARVKPQHFEKGDRVLVFNPRWCQRTYPKWRRILSSEAVIVDRINDITFRVQFARTRRFKIVHSD
jgi:hypothetical protein